MASFNRKDEDMRLKGCLPEYQLNNLYQTLKINKILYDRVGKYIPIYQYDNEFIYDKFENALIDSCQQVRIVATDRAELFIAIRDDRIKNFFKTIINLSEICGKESIKPIVKEWQSLIKAVENLNSYSFEWHLGRYKKNIKAIEMLYIRIYESFDLFSDLFEKLIEVLFFCDEMTGYMNTFLRQVLNSEKEVMK